MSPEKIIKNQAKNHLKGNFTVIIAQVMLVLLAYITVLCLGGLAATVAGIDPSQELASDKLAVYAAIDCAQFLLAVLLLPLANGVCRSVCTAARGGECCAQDVFYYCKNGFGLYIKTMTVDVVSAGLFAICSVVMNASVHLSLICENWGGDSAVLLGLLWLPAAVITFFEVVSFYIIFIHYTFSAYGFNDRLPTGFYLWHMYGFALKNFGKAFKLILSFVGWILLCFFVLPAFYTVPYYFMASAMSARWTFEADAIMNELLLCGERRILPCWYRCV